MCGMPRGPNRRAERMSPDREPHWSVEWWLRAAGKWKILRECHQWRHKFFCQGLQRKGTQTHSSGQGSPWRLGGTCMPRRVLRTFRTSWQQPVQRFRLVHELRQRRKTVPECSQLWRPRPAAFPRALVFVSFRLGVCHFVVKCRLVLWSPGRLQTPELAQPCH